MKSLILYFSCLLAFNSFIIAKQYEYNKINYAEFKSLFEFKRTFFTLDGERSNTNIAVGVASDECINQLESPSFRGMQRNAGGNVIATVSLPFKEFPLDLDEGHCAAIYFYQFNSSINEPTSVTHDLSHNSITKWSKDNMRASVLFINQFEYPISLWWKEETKEEVNQGILQPNEALKSISFLGHIFIARKFNTTTAAAIPTSDDPIVDFMVVHESSYTFHSKNRLETCDSDELTSHQYNFHGSQMISFTEGLLSCEDMNQRLIEFTHRVWYIKRLGLNYVQPKLVPPVTKNGFELRQLPVETYAWLKEWYNREQHAIGATEHAVGPCMNQHVAPSGIAHLTPVLKDRLSAELRDTLEGWFGGPLTLTSIYGIRKYTNNSVLRMHVDTVGTHVVSAIINVDQNVSTAWPLVILDHEGDEQRVNMQAGDMLLYESARLLHGRPEAMNGDHYDNIFIHYKPVSGWDYDWI